MSKSGLFPLMLVGFLLPAAEMRAQGAVDFDALHAYLLNHVTASQVTGLAVGIIKDGNVVFARGYGVRNRETRAPVDTQTQFSLASNTKPFTVAALGLLVDEGRLRWQDKVISYLPWFQLSDAYATRELTIGDLLSHRSGLGTFDGDLLWFGTSYSSEEVVRRIRSLPLRNGFRNQSGYQNVLFIAAGLVVEAVSGMPWHEFIERRVLRVLGMRHSSTALAALTADDNHAVPHLDGRPLPFISYDNVGPAGGLNSSVGDMLIWLNMWLGTGVANNAQLLAPQTVRTITASQMSLNGGRGAEPQGVHFLNYGYGWQLSDYAGRKIVRHGGALPGYLSEVAFVPEEKLGIVVLINDLVPIHAAIADKILDLFMTSKDRDYVGETLQAWERSKSVLARRRQERLDTRVPNTTPSLPVASYAGLYREAMYGDAAVTVVDGRLHLTFRPAPELFSASLEHFHFNTFRLQFPAPALEFGLLTFHLGADGTIDAFTIDLPSQDFRFSDLRFVRQRNPAGPPQ